jgi:hypothetical protein
MGSFNVACSVSNLTIHPYDAVRYIPLEKPRYDTVSLYDGNNSLINSHCFYAPVTFPIKGFYDDYGRIAIEEKDNNINFIEEYFGRGINEICNSLESEDDTLPQQIVSGMFVLEEIYQTLIDNCVNDLNVKCVPRIQLENTYDIISGAIKKVHDRISTSDDDDWVKQSHRWTGTFGLLHQVSDKIKANSSYEYHRWSYREFPTLKKIAEQALLHGKLKNDMIDFYYFEEAMYGCNRFYFPAMNGYQFGNDYMTKIIGNKIFQISKTRIAERSK